MSHDIQAAWAATEVANHFRTNPHDCFQEAPSPSDLSIFAVREARSKWPTSDGVVKIESGSRNFNLALEFKRTNEGLHGILTSMGQALSYIHKGFSGAVIVLPRKYDTLNEPAEYVKEVFEFTNPDQPIGIFGYEEPDTSKTSPFQGKLRCYRQIKIDMITATRTSAIASGVETQWAHLREGSSFPSAFFHYLQTAKMLPNEAPEPVVSFPAALVAAVTRLNPSMSSTGGIIKFLSNSSSDEFHDKVWRNFWFKFVFTQTVIPIWSSNRPYVVNDEPTLLLKADGTGRSEFFSKRSDSIKKKLIDQLNEASMTENQAWEEYVQNVHDRAHSFREDIDSGLEHLELLDFDGRPTELGYRFVDACERSGNPNHGTPKAILGAAILKTGQLGAFLHYIYKLSESRFRSDPLEFTTKVGGSRFYFNDEDYLNWLENELANNLGVMRKVSLRGGTRRKPFQAELATLRSYGFVRKFRIGVGLEVNWPSVQEAMEYKI